MSLPKNNLNANYNLKINKYFFLKKERKYFSLCVGIKCMYQYMHIHILYNKTVICKLALMAK